MWSLVSLVLFFQYCSFFLWTLCNFSAWACRRNLQLFGQGEGWSGKSCALCVECKIQGVTVVWTYKHVNLSSSELQSWLLKISNFPSIFQSTNLRTSKTRELAQRLIRLIHKAFVRPTPLWLPYPQQVVGNGISGRVHEGPAGDNAIRRQER